MQLAGHGKDPSMIQLCLLPHLFAVGDLVEGIDGASVRTYPKLADRASHKRRVMRVSKTITRPMESISTVCPPKLSDCAPISALGDRAFSPRTLLLDRLADLEREAISLKEKGASPKGVWIERSRPGRKKFDQVVWKADKPHEWLSGKKSRYIGKLDSTAHFSAIAKFAAGKRLRQIESEIAAIEKQLGEGG